MNSTPTISPVEVPHHVAMIMDGNGRWAERRGQRRSAGHREGARTARTIVEHSVRRGVRMLTLFAFSSENWARPEEEVGLLMKLFLEALQRQLADLAANGVRIRFIGERERLAAPLRDSMQAAEERTAGNNRLQLFIAMSYGGRWDLVQAARSLAQDAKDGRLDPAAIDEAGFASRLALGQTPDPDLFIRTGGECRISNFLLWNLAYTELYFCDTLWPDFGPAEYDTAIDYFAGRERRYGQTRQQIQGAG